MTDQEYEWLFSPESLERIAKLQKLFAPPSPEEMAERAKKGVSTAYYWDIPKESPEESGEEE